MAQLRSDRKGYEMDDTQLWAEQVRLEEEMRHLGISRFRKEHEKAAKRGDLSSTLTGNYFVKAYLLRFTECISEFLENALNGKAGRKAIAAVELSKIEPEVSAFLFLKAILNKVPIYFQHKPCTFTGLAIYGAGFIHDEMRLRYFEANWRPLVRAMWSDFEKRELPRPKRKELVQRKFHELKLEWEVWDKTTMLHVGAKLIELFIKASGGDIRKVTIHQGKYPLDIIQASPAFLEAVANRVDGTEALMSHYLPCVIPPVDWSDATLSRGGYHTNHVTPYPLVKGARKAYRASLRAEEIPEVLASINALQRTPWRVNRPVLDALEYIYGLDKEIAGLPSSNDRAIPLPPPDLAPDDRTSDLSKEYRKACYVTHDLNRRDISKRVQVIRSVLTGRLMEKYDRIYFPHDLDSRGRAYPKPALLNPQGPDYGKGLLEFADGKPLKTTEAACWLAIHGANTYGFDKASLQERVDWVSENEEMILSCAADWKGDLRWTHADSPFQFLAFCLEWQGYDKDGLEHVSHAHIDVDATCSGLQHFSAMLRDDLGGFFVNMVPNGKRQDIYGKAASETMQSIAAVEGADELKQAWLSFGMDRAIAKRSVMVVPYAGTFHACMEYTSDSVEEKLHKGTPHPWPNGKLHEFTVFGAKHLWDAIGKSVPAAVGAMRWLGQVASLVAKSQGNQRIEWVTPLGLPVWQSKFKLTSRQVRTWFDGATLMPRLVFETDELDPRQMASSVAPSFVHSLDAAHMMLTLNYGLANGITNFAAVHDSFGVHACDMVVFNQCIREAFVDIYENHDVLAEFLEGAKTLIAPELHERIPPLPPKGTLDIRGVLDSEFFFS